MAGWGSDRLLRISLPLSWAPTPKFIALNCHYHGHAATTLWLALQVWTYGFNILSPVILQLFYGCLQWSDLKIWDTIPRMCCYCTLGPSCHSTLLSYDIAAFPIPPTSWSHSGKSLISRFWMFKFSKVDCARVEFWNSASEYWESRVLVLGHEYLTEEVWMNGLGRSMI